MTEKLLESLWFWGLLLLIIGAFPATVFYIKGVNDGVEHTFKEAYNLGFMTKEIDDNDKVIYKWSEGKF